MFTMSFPITLQNLKSNFVTFLTKKYNVDDIYEINDLLTNSNGLFEIGKIPFKDCQNLPLNNEYQEGISVTLNELNISCINFLCSKYNVQTIYDLEMMICELYSSDNIFVIGKIPFHHQGPKVIEKKINNIEMPNVMKVFEEKEEIMDDDMNFTIIEKTAPKPTEKPDTKSIKDHFLLQKYGKGLILSCLSKDNPMYKKQWSCMYPDFDEENGGWWKPKGSLKDKKIEGWFFKIDYLDSLMNLELNIICDELDSIKKEKDENDTQNNTFSKVYEFDFLKEYLSNRKLVEDNIIFDVEPQFFEDNFNNLKMILIKYNDQVYSGIPHLKNKCLFFFGNIPF